MLPVLTNSLIYELPSPTNGPRARDHPLNSPRLQRFSHCVLRSDVSGTWSRVLQRSPGLTRSFYMVTVPHWITQSFFLFACLFAKSQTLSSPPHDFTGDHIDFIVFLGWLQNTSHLVMQCTKASLVLYRRKASPLRCTNSSRRPNHRGPLKLNAYLNQSEKWALSFVVLKMKEGNFRNMWC